MAYNWEGIEKIPWETIQAMARDGKSLCGLFFLYDDNTETMILTSTSWDDIVEHHKKGGEFGKEKEWKQMTETEEQKADAARGDRVKQAKEHWLEFDDVPMNPETECIEAPFLHFPAGTHREEIWNWFEEYYRVPVYDLLYDFDNIK